VGVRDSAVYETHPELSGIFVPESELGGTTLHGTHVTGIIAGRSKEISGYWGQSTIKGVAPDTAVLFREHGDWLSYYADFSAFKNNNVQISNHSYGFLWFGSPVFEYNTDTHNYDAYCDNDDMLLVVGAGNESAQYKILNPGTG
jgi:subtilisin family serine protease